MEFSINSWSIYGLFGRLVKLSSGGQLFMPGHDEPFCASRVERVVCDILWKEYLRDEEDGVTVSCCHDVAMRYETVCSQGWGWGLGHWPRIVPCTYLHVFKGLNSGHCRHVTRQ